MLALRSATSTLSHSLVSSPFSKHLPRALCTSPSAHSPEVRQGGNPASDKGHQQTAGRKPEAGEAFWASWQERETEKRARWEEAREVSHKFSVLVLLRSVTLIQIMTLLFAPRDETSESHGRPVNGTV